MNIVEHINKSNKTLFSIEILPPLKGQNIDSIFRNVEPLLEFKPPFIDVTYHGESYVYKKQKDGNIKSILTRKRSGTIGVCAAIMNKYNVHTVPHIICMGLTKQYIEGILIDLDFLGIRNVLVIRGDFDPSHKYNSVGSKYNYSYELVEQIKRMNKGYYLNETEESPSQTKFCVGVAGYPEKHFEAPNIDTDIINLKNKVDAGADYIVTQMFFDNSKFFSFVERCRKIGINVPIIPGLKVITNKRQISLLPKKFFLDIPQELIRSIEREDNPQNVRRIGIEWAIQQSLELKKKGVPVIHYYTMGRSESIYDVASKVF